MLAGGKKYEEGKDREGDEDRQSHGSCDQDIFRPLVNANTPKDVAGTHREDQ
jgi:hypothetical protein